MKLHQARAKIERANHHIDQMEARIMALHESDVSVVKVDPETREEILIHDLSDSKALECIPLILGDAVHNLKCALDYSWLKVLQCLAPNLVTYKTMFPALKLVNELEGTLKKARVDAVCPALYELMVDCVAANSAWQHAIWTVHRLDVEDKHKLLTPVLTKVNIVGIEGIDESGDSWHGQGISDPQKPPYFVRYKRGLHITNRGKLTAEIVIENVDLEYFVPISGTISSYSSCVSGVVGLFESFLEMQGY